MSSTSMLVSKRLDQQSSVPLSPTKRRRLSTHALANSSHTLDVASNYKAPSTQEIWNWTLTKEAIALCFVRDVFDMRDSGMKGGEFFWLGRIPCRTACIVGIVVGIQVYEKRTIFIIDDGTATVDCMYTHPPPPRPALPSPKKKEAKIRDTTVATDPLAKYRAPPPVSATAYLPNISTSELPLQPPLPVAEIGQLVRLRGRIISWKEKTGELLKRIMVDEIACCLSSNEEARHWLTVLELHDTLYHNDTLGKFVIPPPLSIAPPSAIFTDASVPVTPSRHATQAVDPDFTSSSLAESSVASSSPVAIPSKPSETKAKAKPKLRHPSRLHSRDLTENTFRLYVKHYMENAPVLPPSMQEDSESEGECGLDVELLFVTPTKPDRRRAAASERMSDMITPRARRPIDRTPRANRAHRPPTNMDSNQPPGFTISYLRRIPELASLAWRVVDAEGRRRARREKQALALRDAPGSQNRSRDPSQARSEAQSGGMGKKHEPPGPKMKRLFGLTIVKLYEEGAIMLWEGPVRPLPMRTRLGTCDETTSGSGMWKGDSSSQLADSSVFSLGPRGSQHQDRSASSMLSSSKILRSLDETRSGTRAEEEDQGALSDPPGNEDAYIPLTPGVLAPHVEHAIGVIVDRERRRARVLRTNGYVIPADQRVEPGATKETIVAFLARSDERWAKVGEWAVQDALSMLEEEGRVWCVGEGRWELCL